MTETRASAIAAVRAQLERRASPRLHMSALVMATSVAGLIASWGLLHAGVRSMAVRYPLAVGLAYVAFLALVGLWLRRFRLRRTEADTTRRRPRQRGSVGPGLDLVDVVEVPVGDLFRPSATPAAPAFRGFGGGGGGSGGGSSGDWGEWPTAPLPAATLSAAGDAPSGGGGGSGTGGLDVDEDSFWIVGVVVIVAVVVSVLVIAAYVVYSAPALLAELLLDAGLAAGLYGRLARGEPHVWLRTAVRGTIVPAALTALVLGLAGFGLQRLEPGATSIGRVLERLAADSTATRPGSTR